MRARVETGARRRREWAERQDAGSATGVAIGIWRRYRQVEGPRQSLLLSAYLVLAVLPALLVVEEYLERNPRALADHLVRHYRLSAQTAGFLRGVLSQAETHKLGSALFAIAGALFFGLGFGQVLQRIHARAWRLEVRETAGDQMRYAAVLLTLVGMFLLLSSRRRRSPGIPPGPGWRSLPAGSSSSPPTSAGRRGSCCTGGSRRGACLREPCSPRSASSS